MRSYFLVGFTPFPRLTPSLTFAAARYLMGFSPPGRGEGLSAAKQVVNGVAKMDSGEINLWRGSVKFGSRWASVTDVTDRLRQARENREAQRRLIDSLNEKAQRRQADMENNLSDVPASQRTPLVDRAVSTFRGELKRTTADARTHHVVAGHRHAVEGEAIKAHYSSPVQMLMRNSLGSERRSRIQQQIASSGPAELASLAELAASTRDMELAAALCSRVSTMKLAERPFAPQELADVLMGEDYRRVTACLLEIDRLAVETAEEERAFVTGKKRSDTTIRTALMKQSEDAVGADLSDLEAV